MGAAREQPPLRGSWARSQVSLIVLAVGIAAALTPFATFGHPAWWALPALAIAVAVSELAVLRFRIRSEPWSLSATHAVLTLAFALAPGSWLVLSVPAGAAVAALLRRQRAPAILFAAAQYAAATAAGTLGAHVSLQAGLPRLTAAAVAMIAFWLVQTPLVAAVQAHDADRRWRSLLAVTAPAGFVHTAASASVGLLAASLTLTAPAGLVGLLVPVALLWSSFGQTSNRGAEARLFAELARGQEQAGGGSIDGSAQVVLTAAARLLGCHYVEMLVFAADGMVRYAGDAAGVPARQRVGVDAMDAAWVAETLAAGVATGSVAGRPYVLMRVGPADRPLALLRCARPAGDGSFSRQDSRLAKVLVAQAESWLSVADLAPSAPGADDGRETADDTARALRGGTEAGPTPALAVLRQSAGRLARLAQRDVDRTRIGEIVEELHAVERAVASLLGTVALASDADPAVDDAAWRPGPAARTAQAEWTSSGVLA